MKNSVLVLCLALCGLSIQAQGIDFFQGTWEEALEQATAQDKLIFVDAYATWCGPCKRMAATVFPDERVGAFYNRNFINLKIDMEAPENATFRNQYPVSAFPTLFYIDGTGKIVMQTKGAQQVDQLIRTGTSALAQSEPIEDYAELYENGDRDPNLVYKYTRSLIRNGEPHLRVANDYLRSQTDLNTPQNLDYIVLAATEADSRIFTMMTDRRDAIITHASEEVFYSQVYAACEATAKKAIEFSSEDLLDEAIEKMEAHSPNAADKFRYQVQMEYALAHRDAKLYARAAEGHAENIINEDAQKLQHFALEIGNEMEDDRVLKVAQAAAEQAAELDTENYMNHYSIAVIAKKRGDTKTARSAAEKALQLAEEKMPRAVKMLEQFIEKLDA